MHLLVLSAFRQKFARVMIGFAIGSQCTFWCSVLSDWTIGRRSGGMTGSQCTFWCSVLSDQKRCQSHALQHFVSMQLLVLSAFRHEYLCLWHRKSSVSMHLLVLSAFRQDECTNPKVYINKSQCTFWCSVLSDWTWRAIVVTDGWSQCTFWCSVLSDISPGVLTPSCTPVSMHLLVLSAFRRKIREV